MPLINLKNPSMPKWVLQTTNGSSKGSQRSPKRFDQHVRPTCSWEGPTNMFVGKGSWKGSPKVFQRSIIDENPWKSTAFHYFCMVLNVFKWFLNVFKWVGSDIVRRARHTSNHALNTLPALPSPSLDSLGTSTHRLTHTITSQTGPPNN